MHIDLGKVRLRKPELSDVEALFAQKNDPEVAGQLGGFTKGYSRADIVRWIEAHAQARDEALYVIADLQDRCLGHVGLYNIDHRIGSAEFAIMIGDKASWGSGIGRACTTWAVAYAFNELALHRVYLSVIEPNERARRLYDSIGFTEEGRLRHGQWRSGRWVDVIAMAVLVDEWARRSPAARPAKSVTSLVAPSGGLPNEREQFWREWYRAHTATSDGREATWLDYSTDEGRGRALQAQTLALVIEAGGPVSGLRCLDAGCGWGQLARCLDVLGGRVTAVDFVEEMLAVARSRQPTVEWVIGSFLDEGLMAPLGAFDRVFSVEALQCVGPGASLGSLWNRVAPGGRLVAILPNSENPLTKKVADSMPGRYEGLAPAQLMRALLALDGAEHASVRGLSFSDDQRISPYTATPWTTTPDWSVSPNRLIGVAVRAPA